MALRRHSGMARFFTIIGLVILGAFAIGVVASGGQKEASASSPASPSELICHTDNPADCYPRVFQPTKEFQTIHDDQEIPPGLHVRLDITTGLKEAKINDPDEVNPELEGLPVDSSVVVVDPEVVDEPYIAKEAPVYEPVGKIKPPTQESGAFYDSLDILKKGLSIDEALEDLEDISHDIYYGLKIAEDYETLKSLFCLSSQDHGDAAGANSLDVERTRLASLIIAGTTQNNAKALEQIEHHWSSLMKESCLKTDNLLEAMFVINLPSNTTGNVHSGPSLAKARISALIGLLKSPKIRKQFLFNGGMEHVLSIFTKQGPEWEAARKRAGQLVMDTFLDESMGAVLGEWPTGDAGNEGACKSQAPDELREACWDFHAKKLAGEHKRDKDHWSSQLWQLLSKQRGANKHKSSERRVRDEL